MFICMQKITLIPNSFLELSQWYSNVVWVICTYFAKPMKKNSINFQKTLMLINMQKINFITNLWAWDTAKILYTCYFEYFGNAWLRPSNVIVLTCRKLWCLSAQKVNSSLTSFLRYCKDFANLLFLVLWAWLAISTKIVWYQLVGKLDD